MIVRRAAWTLLLLSMVVLAAPLLLNNLEPLQRIRIPPSWKITAAGVAAVAALFQVFVGLIPWLLDRRSRRILGEQRANDIIQTLSRELRLWRVAKNECPLVREIDDPTLLGVSPSAKIVRLAEGEFPPYVERDRDSELDKALKMELFVLVVGDSKAGKSRSAFEAISKIFPQRLLIVPETGISVAMLLDLNVELTNAVIWLDDLENYLGPRGLTINVLERLRQRTNKSTTVLATMRTSEYAKRTSGLAINTADSRLLKRGVVIFLDRKLNDAERGRARATKEYEQIEEALERYGLAEYLSAGPDLIDRLEVGRALTPVGAAIVQAATDWRRCGLTRPVSAADLAKMCPVYLDEPYVLDSDSEQFIQGLDWATEQIYGVSSLLAKRSTGYEVFDYILDYVDHERQDTIPPAVWDVILGLVDDPADFLSLAISSHDEYEEGNDRTRREFAELAYRKAADDLPGIVGLAAATNLGSLFAGVGQRGPAEDWWTKAAEAGFAPAAYVLAESFHSRRNISKSEHWYRVAADQGFIPAMHDLGVVLHKRGEDNEAELWLRRAAEAGDVASAADLGYLLLSHDNDLESAYP
jgi:hypothetical protein